MTNMNKKRNQNAFGQNRSGGRIATAMMVAFAFVSDLTLLLAQNPPAAPPDLARGQKVYAEHCVGCHGADFRGTDQGPGLTGNSRVRRMSLQRLRNIITNGIPNSGMPPFDLPAQDLDALAPFVRSLNSRAAESSVPGNTVAGERFFFGKGECGSCHMVSGRGQPIGPDLSDLGDERTVDEIQSALKEPGADITPGYELVTVRLRDGNTLRGFARNRSNFDIRLEDLQGKLHLLEEGQIASIVEERQSVMPPVEATPEELQDLMAYLSRLTGVKPRDLAPRLAEQRTQERYPPPQAGDIDFERILHPQPGDWLAERQPVQRAESDQHRQRKPIAIEVDIHGASLEESAP